MKKLNSVTLALIFGVLLSSCEIYDPHQRPDLQFKIGSGYTSSNTTVVKGALVKVGIVADKTEGFLKTYSVSYSLDGSSSTKTKGTFILDKTEEQHYEKDFEFAARTVSGTEQWYFTITDHLGNIAQLTMTITVN